MDDTLELLVILVLESVQLVMLEQDALLDHRLVRLCEKVIFLDVMVLIRTTDNFGHVSLQIVTLSLLVLAGLTSLLLLLH